MPNARNSKAKNRNARDRKLAVNNKKVATAVRWLAANVGADETYIKAHLVQQHGMTVSQINKAFEIHHRTFPKANPNHRGREEKEEKRAATPPRAATEAKKDRSFESAMRAAAQQAERKAWIRPKPKGRGPPEPKAKDRPENEAEDPPPTERKAEDPPPTERKAEDPPPTERKPANGLWKFTGKMMAKVKVASVMRSAVTKALPSRQNDESGLEEQPSLPFVSSETLTPRRGSDRVAFV